MFIFEITQTKVSKAQGNEVELDHGDGTKTVIDTKKNPNAIQRDEKGKLKVTKQSQNSKMRAGGNNNQPRTPRAGEKIDIEEV